MNKQKSLRLIFSILMLLGFSLMTACGQNPVETLSEEPPPAVPESSTAAETDTKSDTKSDTQESVISNTEEVEEGLPLDTQTVPFSTSDGFELNGVFYPAAKKSQPLVILMHWAPGDQNDWVEIAYWLQNRGLGGNTNFSEETPWLDSSWFPSVGKDTSFNVFTFTFRDCEGGCKRFTSDEWYLDAQAAVERAVALEGIDETKIAMIGASIGSDGVADGCAYVNTIYPTICKGVVSFSPGNYLNVDFGEMVAQLGSESEPKPIWCFYSEDDIDSANVCGNITGNNYQPYPYSGNAVFSNGHGMNLITPISDPNPLEKVLEFLELVF